MHCSLKKFERMLKNGTGGHRHMFASAIKDSNKSRFNSYSHWEQCTDHIPYYLSGLLRAHCFRQPFSKYLYRLYREVRPFLRFKLPAKFQPCIFLALNHTGMSWIIPASFLAFSSCFRFCGVIPSALTNN